MRRASAVYWQIRLALALCAGLCSAHASAAAGNPSSEPIHFTRAQMLQQDGGSLGPPPAQVDSNGPAGAWSEAELPNVSLQRLTATALDGTLTGIATTWYRVHLDTDFAGHLPASIYLYLPRWETVGQVAVYGDGRLLFNSRGGAVWNGFNHPVWVPLAPTAGASLPHTLLIRLSSVRATGGAISTVWVGPQDELMWRYRARQWLQVDLPYMSSAAFLALGLFALAVWAVRRRRESVYGLYFAASLMFYVRCLHYHWGLEPIPIPEDWFTWATVNSLGWLMVAFYFFCFRLHGRSYPWLERGFIALISLPTVIMLPPLKTVPLLDLLSPLAYMAMAVGGVIVVAVALWAAWRARSRDALVLALFNLVMLSLAFHDLLLMKYQISAESIYLTLYGGIGEFIIFLVIVSRRYISALAEVEQSRAQLAQRLREREAELAESYEKLRIVEYEQTLSQERSRLMQDMHDGLGSSLMSALRMVERGQIGEADVAQVLKECIDDLKLTIDSLEPVETDLLLLMATLRFRLEPRLEGTGLTLRWDVSEVPALPWLDPRNALHILRMLQEAFTNVIKHAQASEIHVSTATDGEGVAVRINDNGQGLPADAHQRGGKGLANLRRRAQAIGARLRWEPLARGTCFELWLPLQAPAGSA